MASVKLYIFTVVSKFRNIKRAQKYFYYEGVEVLTAVIMTSCIFWDITPCTLLKSRDISEEYISSTVRTKNKLLLATCITLISWVAYFSALKMEATYFSRTSTDFQQITRRYIPEGRTLIWNVLFRDAFRSFRQTLG
jgi:cytosine/uracil/thiamine/allantoin permease